MEMDDTGYVYEEGYSWRDDDQDDEDGDYDDDNDDGDDVNEDGDVEDRNTIMR